MNLINVRKEFFCFFMKNIKENYILNIQITLISKQVVVVVIETST